VTRRCGAALLAGVLLLLTGCGLPLESGVQTPESAAGSDQVAGADQSAAYLPPGPRAGQPPDRVVRGFLGAQASADDDHAIARRFLAPELRQAWNDDAQVKVYDPERLDFELLGDEDGDALQVRVTGVVTSTIAGDGSVDPEDGVLDDTYSLGRDAEGNWVLTDVPDGLRLSPNFVERSYAQQIVYYPALGTGPQGHLVPDPALLLVEKDPAAGLVRRLVAGPSVSLRGAVDTAVPAGAQVVAVTTDAEGVVTVDLGPEVAGLSAADRERLSAQLVWTLRGVGPAFTSLRLLSAGRPVDVPRVEGETQDRTAWQQYDPDGLPQSITTYYLADRRLRTLESGGRPVRATADYDVDGAAVSPRTDRLAVLTDVGEGRSEVRVGRLSGPVPVTPVYTGGGLRSPSWGSGRRGLWLLQTGPRPQVLLLQPNGEALPVPIPDPPPGRLTALRVSRDGARIAMVSGEDDASRRVYVAPVVEGEGGVRISRPREIGFGVTDVSDVAWESPTSVVAIGRYTNVDGLPLRLSIDGSGSVDLVRLPGLQQVTPESLAAGPERPLVVSATRDGRPVLFRSSGGVFVEEPVPGYAPFYPG
jgi:hypothetical protein